MHHRKGLSDKPMKLPVAIGARSFIGDTFGMNRATAPSRNRTNCGRCIPSTRNPV